MLKQQKPLFDDSNYEQSINKDYLRVEAYLDDLLKRGIKKGLERIKVLSKKLKNPELSYPVIQIAGTNGKTSVTKMVSAILKDNGLKVGTYISPHLFNYRERFIINGHEISEKSFDKLVKKIKPKVEETDELTRDPITNFEVLTAMAFKYFAEEKVDVAVVETGLGGRYDATSITNPAICVITNVGLDHTDILGETVSEIAREKAAIIKRGTRTVTGKLNLEAQDEVEKKSNETGSKVFELGKDFDIYSTNSLLNGRHKLDINGIYVKYSSLVTPSAGRYQISNTAVAVAAAEIFLNKALKRSNLSKVISSIKMQGRMEVIAENPTILLDVTHNPDGAKELAVSIGDLDFNKLIIVISVYKDKDYRGIIKYLEPISDKLFCTENPHERSADVKLLAKCVKNKKFEIEPNIDKAIEKAIKEARSDDLVCITGSFSTVSAGAKYLFKKADNN